MKHLPKKRFGQNFLHDASVLQQIIAAIAPSADDCMVEIGPGKGAMTGLLLAQLRELHVVELDREDVRSLVEFRFREVDGCGITAFHPCLHRCGARREILRGNLL